MFFKFTASMQRVRRFCASGCGAGKCWRFFSRLPRCMVGLEACATAQYWARELGALGHEVRLMPAQYVKAYVKRNKNDAADAEAICGGRKGGRPRSAVLLRHLYRQRSRQDGGLAMKRREFITLLGG